MVRAAHKNDNRSHDSPPQTAPCPPSRGRNQKLADLLTLAAMNWSIHFYSERVRQGIRAWPVGIRADFLRLVELMQEHGADLRLPHSRAMGDGLFELRCKGAEGIGRVFYCTLVGRQIVILHSFIKKTQETPERDLKTARKRLKDVNRG